MYSADEYKQKMEKAKAAQERARKKQLEKLSDPDYRQKQIEKKKMQAQKAYDKNKSKTKSLKNKKKTTSKGMKGRSPTALEKELMNEIAKIGCICCLNEGLINTNDINESGINYISLHHTEGRTKEYAHAKVLPLCEFHHDVQAPGEFALKILAYHVVGRKTWERTYGSQEILLKQVYEIIGRKRPWVEE